MTSSIITTTADYELRATVVGAELVPRTVMLGLEPATQLGSVVSVCQSCLFATAEAFNRTAPTTNEPELVTLPGTPGAEICAWVDCSDAAALDVFIVTVWGH